MKAPAPAVRLIGHPTVTGLVLLAGIPSALFFALHGSDGIIFAIIIGVLMERTMRANAAATEYRAWKAAWDGMEDRPPCQRRTKGIVRAVVAAMGALFALANIHDPQILGAVGLIGLALAIWAVTKVAGRFRIRTAAPKNHAKADLVTVAVRGPLLPSLTLQQAFAALPEHCQRLRRASPL